MLPHIHICDGIEGASDYVMSSNKRQNIVIRN
jgi:hypothetical protein